MASLNATTLAAITCSRGAALLTREDAGVELLAQVRLGVRGQDETSERSAKRLVRGGCDHVGVRQRRRVQTLIQEAYIVFTANAFALMGLRQMFFLLDGLLDLPLLGSRRCAGVHRRQADRARRA